VFRLGFGYGRISLNKKLERKAEMDSKGQRTRASQPVMMNGKPVKGSETWNQASNMNNNNATRTIRSNMEDGTRVLGITSLILAFVWPLLGVIIGAIGRKKVKELQGIGVMANGSGLVNAGFGLSIVFMIIQALIFLAFFIPAILMLVTGESEFTYGPDGFHIGPEGPAGNEIRFDER